MVSNKEGEQRISKVSDLICFPCLEGRPCLKASEQRREADVVVVPVLNKRSLMRSSAAPTEAASGPPPRTAHAAVEMVAAAAAAGELRSAGLRVILDDDLRKTPGEKYHYYEHRGFPTRVEIGAIEASAGTASICLHPRLALLHPLRAALSELQLAAAGSGQRKAVVPLSRLASTCKTVLDIVQTLPEEVVAQPTLCSKLHLFRQPAEGAAEHPAAAVCAAHVRHLVGVSMPCHCCVGHVSLATLKAEVCLQAQAEGRGEILGWGRRQGRSDLRTSAEEGGDEEAGGPCTLLVVGFPRGCPAARVRNLLLRALSFAEDAKGLLHHAHLGWPSWNSPLLVAAVYVPRAHRDCTRGWARVTFSSVAQARSAIERLLKGFASEDSSTAELPRDAAFTIEGHNLRVSFSTGRNDTVFPFLPYEQRRRLRVDPVASFSVTGE